MTNGLQAHEAVHQHMGPGTMSHDVHVYMSCAINYRAISVTGDRQSFACMF